MEHVLSLWRDTVRRFPEKRAVTCGDQEWTFCGMDHRAKQIAAMIRHIDADHNQPVAVMVRRDADTAVLFLGVLYSGNYYVPVDPDMPASKKMMVLEDCQAKILLCGEDQKGLLDGLGYTGQVLTMEDAVSFSGDRMDDEVVYSETDPIYMVYTSGSTGRPKGVLKNHRAVCSFIRAFAAEFGLTDREIIGNQTPFFFDASAKDIYLMFYTGATLDVIPSEKFVLPPGLIQYLNERKITYICWVPTALAMVTQLNTFSFVMPETLRKVFFVGEAFPVKQLNKWMKALPELEYVNLYGSTELSGISCYCRLDTSQELTSVPMGGPLSNCTVFLWDSEKQETVKAEERERTGEVCVISDAMADEYYHDPEKTAQVFTEMKLTPDMLRSCADPSEKERLTQAGTARVLHTGDLARYDESGRLVFASRKDFQIKHMGRRIELGEIESIADQLEEIQRCCCLYDSEKKKIRLFCELVPGCEWKGRDVRSALKGHLTDYMLPSQVIILEKLPLNANGKIDRTKLKSI